MTLIFLSAFFEASKTHAVKCFVTKGLWFEVGNEPDLKKAKRVLKNNSSDYLKELLRFYEQN